MTIKVSVERTGKDDFRLDNGKSADTLNPKELILFATACCAGKTVVAIIDKQHIDPQRLCITMCGELDTESLSAQGTFSSFDIRYHLQCSTPDEERRARQSVKLADEKYCGNLKMMRRIAPVKSEIEVGKAVEAL